MEPYVLVLGEALTDLIESVDHSGLVYRPRFGGSPLNVAVGVRRLGVGTEFVSAGQLADLIKLSGEDAEYLYPGATLEQALDVVRGGGDAIVIMTRAGTDTALLYDGHVSSVPIVPIELVDPTGAGDSFTAWVLQHIVAHGMPSSRDAWHQLIQEANAAAAITCSRLGGAESMPTMQEVRRLLVVGNSGV
jgi:sugar/nucleoside kinase (ribokinase family)